MPAPYPCGKKHKVSDDFSVVTHLNVRLWICSHCGKRASWGKGWGLWGNVECRKCQAQSIDWVACSDKCATALGGDDMVLDSID